VPLYLAFCDKATIVTLYGEEGLRCDAADVAGGVADVAPLVSGGHVLDAQGFVVEDFGSSDGHFAVRAPPQDGRRRLTPSGAFQLHALTNQCRYVARFLHEERFHCNITPKRST